MVIVASEVERLAVALGRNTDVHITQVCPLCECKARRVGRGHGHVGRGEHRCATTLDPFTLFERAERALVTAPERIGEIDDPSLRTPAAREAERMAVRASSAR